MTKFHLVARAPSEGARRLAWFLLHEPKGAVDLLAARIHEHVGKIDRLLSGEVVPGGDLAFAISVATGRAVAVADWYRDADGGWGDQPVQREHQPLARAA